MLIAVLLAYGAVSKNSDDERARGLALKSLNGGLAALDIAESAYPSDHLPMLRRWAGEILGNLYCEGIR